MNKFNALGMEVLSYKNEYLNKDYPQLVHNSIAVAIDNKENIPDKLKLSLKDMSIDYDAFKQSLLSESSCLKTYEELMLEYEAIRASIENKIKKDKDELKDIVTFSKVENEEIEIKQEFVITEEFIRNYFSISSESEFEALMARKGFIEKFSILRLTKIFDNFMNELEKEAMFNVSHSLTFFKSEKNVYGIYMEYRIPIDNLEEENTTDSICEKIHYIANKAYENYKNHMLV